MDLDDITVFTELNDTLRYSFLPVEASEDRTGCITIRFKCGRELFLQLQSDIEAVLDNMYLFNNQFFILDEYLAQAKYPGL